ncbi:hypothetical protein LZ906_006250 [Paraclostridium ghonii]|uniref:hypothetical protein n=1 Tax=Paraclostridium ghonii TaxID=29358 RepID=UPI00202D0B16|nr:hypothetical protein [Paeniclostridium ghonii]MCM0167472.1 hypothetical protein [Paeniclostridium ghonii]
MKSSLKNKKMARITRTFSDISKIFVLSSVISVSIISILILVNAFNGIFIGFRYYIMLTMAMVLTLTPCWVLCDSKRIFSVRNQRRSKVAKAAKRPTRSRETIRRRKIS